MTVLRVLDSLEGLIDRVLICDSAYKVVYCDEFFYQDSNLQKFFDFQVSAFKWDSSRFILLIDLSVEVSE